MMGKTCMLRSGLAALSVVLLLAGCSRDRTARVPDVSLSTCLRDLTNVAVFARTPLGRAGMISTYDTTGGNLDWAQWKHVGPGPGEVELANLEGPGCIRRIWTTGGSAKGRWWSFYIDGEKEPRIRVQQADLVGGSFPFIPPLARQLSGGEHCYVPIPYEKSIRIVFSFSTYNRGPYYHICYETYPKDVRVESYPETLSGAETQLLKETGASWATYESVADPRRTEFTPAASKAVVPGASADIFEYDGAGTIRSIRLRVGSGAGVSPVARAFQLRALVMRIFWDGMQEPSVDVPLGDFFCNGLDWRSFSSLPLANSEGLLVSRFPMPFMKSVRMELRNDGNVPVEIAYDVDLDRAPVAAGSMNYLHATWNQSLSTGIPFRIFRAQGRGHYVGCYLVSHGMDGSWNMLEGDETFLVDGEMTPSIHGTGLEDYFNGGWYYYGLYDLPLYGLVEKAAMQTAQYRFHLPDPISFDTSLSLAFEFGDGNGARGYMSGVAYWYQDQPCAVRTRMPPLQKRFPPLNEVERAAIMTELFELERMGLQREAMDRCLSHAAKYPKSPDKDMLKLRVSAYREALHGYAGVKSEYETVATTQRGSEAAKQAETLMWFHESPSNALLCAHVNGTYKIYLDGKLVGVGDHPLALSVHRLKIAPGQHEMAAEVIARRTVPWFRMTLRTATADIVTGAEWEVRTVNKPRNWPQWDDAGTEWEPVRLHIVPPWMPYWTFAANAFVNTQAGRHFLRPKGNWINGTTAYFRKRFVVPAERVGTVPGAQEDVGQETDVDETQIRWTDRNAAKP